VASKRWTPLIAGLSVAAALWIVGGALQFASWRSGVTAERARHAPLCSTSEVFADIRCQITLPATMTKITGGEIDVTVAGRAVSAPVTLSGGKPDASRGIPVQVTIYRGRVIHVAGEDLRVDTNYAPSTKSGDYRFFGYLFVAFGIMGGLWAALGVITHRDDG
jgi:hypothetical protein